MSGFGKWQWWRGAGVWLVWALTFTLVGAAVGCGPGGNNGEGTKHREVRELVVDFSRDVVIESSVLEFRLNGTNRMVAPSARVVLEGRGGDYPDLDTFYGASVERDGDVGDLIVRLEVADSIWPELQPKAGESFRGEIAVELYDEIGVLAVGTVEKGHWRFETRLAPDVQDFQVGEVHTNEALEVKGGGFLRPEEGTTWAVIDDGTLTRSDETTKSLAGERIRLEWDGRRDRGRLRLDPGVFGVREAAFDAVLHFENELQNGEEEPETVQGSVGHQIQGTLQQSYIASLTPDAGSRGQKITVDGRGFVRTNDEAGYGMFFRYEGKFTPRNDSRPVREFSGATIIERVPDRVISEDTVEQSIWYSVEDRKLDGLGAMPGTFEGKITPILFDESGEQEGLPWEGSFRVLPTKQIIYLKYLPAFSKALEKYGLRNVEREIRDRIKFVVSRDYGNYHVEVREEKPDDFIDYATVELGGPDPTGSGAFGFDNSFNGVAKDTGNLFLADYLGGVNAQAAAEFNNPYGGIFIESFTLFSPTLPPQNPAASPKFDQILGPFMPELGGTPVRGSEWPDGPRTDDIEAAVRMVGSVIGNTVTHEVGHSIGMTFVKRDRIRPTDVFHNQVPGTFIMDPGSERPFEERAELPGVERAEWNELNKKYLRQTLPKPE